jgi:hypothetical protein
LNQPTIRQFVTHSEWPTKSIRAQGEQDLGILSLGGLSVGQNVIVYYASADPNESCVGIPDELVKNEIAPIVLAGITFPVFALTVWTYRYAPFKRWLFN